MKKLGSLTAIVALFAIMSAQSAFAAEFISPGMEDRGTVSISSTETHKNLYTAGASVMVSSKILGDLYVVGGTVDISNDVEQDVVAAGGNVTIDGKVGGDARVAGGTIKLNGPVSGDVLVAGGNIIISNKSSIGGDLVVTGGSVLLEAPVAGSVRAAAGSIVINSAVSGGVTIGESTKDQGLIFGSEANISGAFVMYGVQRDFIKKDGAKVPAAEFRAGKMNHSGRAVVSAILGAIVIKLLASILALLLILKLMPRRVQSSIDAVLIRPWSNLGIGFAVLILTPIVAVLSFIIAVGYYIGLVILALYLVALLAAGLLAALFLGSWIIRALTKKPLTADWQAAVLGSVAMILLAWVPIIGWAIDAIVFIMAFGTLVRMGQERLRMEK